MKKTYLILLAGMLLPPLAASTALAATLIIGDDYNVTGSGTGFALGSGVNSGINPPTTRLTGSVASGLRYIKAFGVKADSAHSITTNTMSIARVATDSSTLSLSGGSGAYDFGPALNSLAASPALPAVYELTITIANSAASNQRCSFAISSASGTAGVWDFAIQLYHATTGDAFYTLQKRISAGACGGSAINATISTVGSYGSQVSFLLRVTDAGSEADTNFHSRIEVATVSGTTTNWIYDTSTDSALPAGWRFPGASRFIFWDIAGGAGPVSYDAFTLNWVSGPTSAPRIWSGGGADNNWSSTANWGGVVPSTGDSLVFAGTTRQVNTNDLIGLNVPSVTFSNGGFALYGNAFTNSGAFTSLAGTNVLGGDIAWGSTASKTWTVAGGVELFLNNTNTVEVTGDHNMYGGGTLRLKGAMNIGQVGTANPAFVVNEGKHIVDGGSFISRGGYRIGSLATAAAGAQTIISNGATFTLTVSGANLRVGDSANPVTSLLAVDHSSVSLAGAILGLPYTAGATGIVNQVGGTVAGCRLSFSESGAGQGTYSVQNGTLAALQIRKNTAAGVASISFDNAVLTALSGATNAFMGGLDLAEIKAGGLTLDAQADVVIAQNLTGAGALIKSNSAALTLTGNNTYAGNTIVQGGKLVLPTGKTYTAPIQVADNAELGVAVQAPGTSLTNATLSLGNGGSSTLSFDLGSYPSPTAPLMKVASLSANGAVTINVANGLLLTTGQIVLVDYDGAIGGGGFAAFHLNGLPSGVTANLVNNTANSSIDLNITAVPGFLWTGAVNGDWDYSTSNWLDRRNGLASTYSDGSPTEFPDGAATGVVNLTAFPSPAAISVSNNTLPYVWSGGAITVPTLRKYGTNSLTRMAGEADAITSLELNEGSYVFSNLFDATFSTVLTDTTPGQGMFVKDGPGVLTVSATNSTYDGAVLIKQGIVKLGADRALGSTSASVTIANGATLDLNDFVPGFQPVIVSGAGVEGQGAIIDSKTGTAVDTNLRDVTMAGDTTFGSSGRWDLRVRAGTGPGPGLRGNGYKLTKVGSGSVSIACQRTTTGYWEMNLGDVLIQQGGLTFAEALTLGNPTNIIAIADGASLGTFDLGLTNPLVRNIFMTNATITGGGSPTDTNVFSGTITMIGANTLTPNKDAAMVFNGAIVGSSSLNISGSGGSERVFLNGANTYAADTSLNNATLGGTGIVPGNLLVGSGTLSPGMDGVGTLTVNGSATLGGTNVMELNRALTPNSDRLSVGGALTFGGVLSVVLAAGAPPPIGGDVYQLFSKGGSGVFTSINLPDLSGLPGGLGWDTTKLGVNGTITVTGKSPPTIATVSLAGGNFTFSGTGGVQGNTYYVLSSTNVAELLSSWVPVATNVFGPGGSFSFTTNITGGAEKAFFRVAVP